MTRMEEFRIGDLFEKLKAPYKGLGRSRDNISKVRTAEFSLPLINCKDGNNGIMYYGRPDDFTSYQNVLSVIYNGPPTEGQTYYQPEIGLLSDAYLIRLKSGITIGQELGLYLAAAINKSICDRRNKRYSRGNKATWAAKVEDDMVQLPIQIDASGSPVIDPAHTYHPDGFIPDWAYMQEYIAKLEQELIARLDHSLTAASLNDYTLTNKDREALSTLGLGEAQDSAEVVTAPNAMREFSIPDVFLIKNGHNVLKTDVVIGSGTVPYVTAGESNNSVAGYVDYDKNMIEEGDCIFIGGKTTVFSYQEVPFFSNDSHNLLLYCKAQEGRGELPSLYMITQLKQSLWRYTWNDSISFKKIQSESVMLPIQTDVSGSPVIDPQCTYHSDGFIPDWEYMADYIRAIEKIVIKDVVDYKNAFMDAAAPVFSS